MLRFCFLQVSEIFRHLPVNRAFGSASYLKKGSRLQYAEGIQEDPLDRCTRDDICLVISKNDTEHIAKLFSNFQRFLFNAQ